MAEVVLADPKSGMRRFAAKMYARMLNKQVVPTVEDMAAYCGRTAELFTLLNNWLYETHGTVWKVVFPYGNHYGWGIAHKKKQKLICNIFAEENAFTVMMRLSCEQFQAIYAKVQRDTQEYIDHRYPCGDGGWIHYRVLGKAHFDDIQQLLSAKCAE